MDVINTFLLLYLIWRFHILESRRQTQPAARVIAPGLPEWQKPVDNFNPPKPETLRPNAVKGREAGDNVFEFDVKLKG